MNGCRWILETHATDKILKNNNNKKYKETTVNRYK